MQHSDEHILGNVRTSRAARRAASASAAGAAAAFFTARPLLIAVDLAGAEAAVGLFGGALVQRPLRWLAADADLLPAMRCVLPLTLLVLPDKAQPQHRHTDAHAFEGGKGSYAW